MNRRWDGSCSANRGTAYQIQVGSLVGSLGGLTLNVAGQKAPPPELLSAEVLSGSRTCRLQLRGTPGQIVSVQGSGDLRNWESVGSLRFVSSDAIWSEPILPGVAVRFFRLVSAGQGEPPVQLLSPDLVEGSTVCRLRLRGTPGQVASVQGSTNLVNWESLDSVRFISTNEVWSEPIHPGVAARFFRLVSQP